MANDVSMKVGVDGEASFKQSLANINSELKSMSAEVKAVTTAYDDNDKSAEAVAAQSDVLSRAIEAQQSKMELLANQIAELSQQDGDHSAEINKLQAQYYNAQAAVNGYQSQMSALTEETAAATEETSVFAQVLSAQLLSDAIQSGLSALVDGVKALGSAMVSTVTDTASMGDTIDKASQKAGVTASQYQAMAYAAEHCGFETTTFTRAVKTLQSSGYEGTIYDYMEGLMAIEDPAERMAQAQEVLGESTANQMAALINGETSLAEYQEQLEALGGMMSDETVAQSAAFEDALTDVNTAVEGLKTGLVQDLLPGLTDMSNGLARVLSGQDGGLEEISKGVETFATAISTMLPQLLPVLTDMLDTLGQALKDNLPMLLESLITFLVEGLPPILDALSTAILNVLPDVLEAVVQILPPLVTGICTGLIEHLPEIIQAGITLFTALVEALPEIIDAIVAAIPDIIDALIDAIGTFLSTISDSGKDIFRSLMDGLVALTGTIAQTLRENIWDPICDYFEGVWSSAMDIGSDIISGIWAGISGAWGWLQSQLSGWVSNFLEYLKGLLGIHSPSRITAGFGEYLAEGLAVGFDREMGAVERSIGSSIADLTSSMSGNITAGIDTTAGMQSAMTAAMQSSPMQITVISQLDGREVARSTYSYMGEFSMLQGVSA